MSFPRATTSRDTLMECTECGWQGPSHQCDGGFCSMCGAEAVPWSEVYNEDGTPKEED